MGRGRKKTLDKLTDEITDGAVTNYFDIIFNPNITIIFLV